MVKSPVKGLCLRQELRQVSTLRLLHWAQRRRRRRRRLFIKVTARGVDRTSWAAAVRDTEHGRRFGLQTRAGRKRRCAVPWLKARTPRATLDSAHAPDEQRPRSLTHRSSFVPRSLAAAVPPLLPRPPGPAGVAPRPRPRRCRCVSFHLLLAASFSLKSMLQDGALQPCCLADCFRRTLPPLLAGPASECTGRAGSVCWDSDQSASMAQRFKHQFEARWCREGAGVKPGRQNRLARCTRTVVYKTPVEDYSLEPPSLKVRAGPAAMLSASCLSWPFRSLIRRSAHNWQSSCTLFGECIVCDAPEPFWLSQAGRERSRLLENGCITSKCELKLARRALKPCFLARRHHRRHWRGNASACRPAALANMAAPQVVVVGGGIIGAATAYYLSAKGARPIVVEAVSPACSASGKAGKPAAHGEAGRRWGLPIAMPSILFMHDCNLQTLRRTAAHMAHKPTAKPPVQPQWQQATAQPLPHPPPPPPPPPPPHHHHRHPALPLSCSRRLPCTKLVRWQRGGPAGAALVCAAR